jgi:GLPGLI family protein
MKNIIFVFFISNMAFAQFTKIEYDTNIDLSGLMKKQNLKKSELIIGNDVSLTNLYVKNMDSLKANLPSNTTLIKIGSDTVKYFKDFKKMKLFSEEKIFNKIFEVEDELDIFDWEITNDSISILGHICFKAKTFFRGREFEAYFTNEIAISDGPMKFNGLPGLILKVKLINSNAIFEATATKITNNYSVKNILNPFQKPIEYTNYRDKYIKKITELQSYYAGTGTTIGTNGLEILIFDE